MVNKRNSSMIVLFVMILVSIGIAQALPTVVNVAVNDNLVTEADVAVDGFVVDVDFSEEMGVTEPTIGFSPAVGTTLTNCGGVWTNTTRYTYTCDVADGDVELIGVDVDVSDAKNTLAETMDPDTSSGDNKFDVDTVKPTVVNVDVSDAVLSEGDVAVDGFVVDVDFSEVMGVTEPTIGFSPAVGTTLTNCGGVWTNTTRYTYTCDIEDANVASDGVDVDVSDAKDVAGNTMAADTTTGDNKFDVDTVAPVISVAGAIELITDLNSDGVAGIGDTINYTIGTVASADGDSWTVNLSVYGLSAVATPGQYVIIAGDDEGVFSATEKVTDNAGNTVSGSVDKVGFTNIDNKRPTVSNIIVNDAVLSESDVAVDGVIVVVDFSEGMDVTEPTIGFSPAVGTTLTNCAGVWTNISRYTYTCDVADGDVELTGVDVDVSDAKDVTSNTMAADTTTGDNKFDVDTVKPVLVITMSDVALIAGETANVMFNFSEVPTSFDLEDLTNASGALSSFVSVNNTIYTATFTPTVNIEDATNFITVGTSWLDVAGNAPAGSTNSPNYEVDTLRPTVIITLNDSVLIVGETATVTFNFSETPTVFNESDLTVPSGLLSDFGNTSSTVYTATFTPTAGVEDNLALSQKE